ncbi:MAG TPA: adenosine kinase [Acidimicrobiales bacterium]|nr:adenosine kinase [Acidimicrobiales bacterium]
MENNERVVTVGHAIVDVLSPSDDGLVERLGLHKGTMALVDGEKAELIYSSLGPATEASGGSAANTAACLASLGEPVVFVGKVAADPLGKVFSHDIRAAGVRFDSAPESRVDAGTGRCLILVTPDAEKTMCTNLGIGAMLGPADVDVASITAAEIVYMEGYLYGERHTDQAVEEIIRVAKAAGTKVALSLSDPAWVDLNAPHFDRILDQVDLLFANEEEARRMTDSGDAQSAVEVLAERCETVVVTLGAQGSLVRTGRDLARVPAAPVDHVVDTTGAGDSYAAGFLYGFVNDLGPERSARLGALASSEVVSHLGARPLRSLAELARRSGLTV